MLRTIEIEIDANGYIHPLEPVCLPVGRALLTVLEETTPPFELPQTINKSNAFQDLCGILTAQHGATFEEMEQAISLKVQGQFNDCSGY